MRPIKYYIRHPFDIVTSVAKKVKWAIPDKTFIRILFRNRMGYWPNLKHPKTFSEKLQWLKLYDRKPIYTTMVDKFAVKEYVASLIGEEFIISTLGVWDKPEDIEWDKLPDQFVLKCTHNSGGLVICRDKATLDKEAAIIKLRNGLKRNYYLNNREWPYKNVPRRIIAEKYMEDDETQELRDYKFFCFNGEPKYCQVISGRSETMCIDFFDMDWNHQPFHEPKNYPFAAVEPKKPSCFEQMRNAAWDLAQGRSFSRIDFYQVGNKMYFGEITFFPTSGMGGFKPEKWDYEFGSWIKLPKTKIRSSRC